MKCVISGQNAMVLAKAIHSFARIGHDLFLEVDAMKGLALRTVNLTKSSFAMILFNLDFFTSFTVKSNPSDPYENQCKLSMKSCLGVFRNMKQVETCMITIDPKNFKVIVQFKCKLETVRTHHISIIEHEGLQASYTADRTLNTLSGSYKLFSNIISNFKINEEELSIIATERNVLIQNYLVGSFVDSNFVRSHITLKPEEFESYKIAEDTTIIFCMRELRAILSFAESMNASISANFNAAGDPIVFVVRNFDTFEANLVMSTMSPEDMDVERARGQADNADKSVQRKKNESKKSIGAEESKKSIETEESELVVQRGKRSFVNVLDSQHSGDSGDRSRVSSLEVVRKKRRTSSDTDSSGVIPDERLTNRTERVPFVAPDSDDIRVVFEDESEPTGNLPPSIDLDCPMIDIDADVRPNENEAENDVRPRRDHRPRMREIFKVCFMSDTQETFRRGKVLAECSDEEDGDI